MPVKPRPSVLPFLRWAGSKRQLLPKLSAQIPGECNRYVEPFAGSACLFFHTRPAVAMLSDFNPDLIQSFQVVAKHPRLLARLLATYPNDAKTYYALREIEPKSLPEIPRAARFIYLNSFCFNGVYRTNGGGQFNVPRGSKSGGVPTSLRLNQCSMALRNAKVTCQDFRRTLASCMIGDFVYLDPPYTKPGTRNRGEYGAGSFSADDEEALIEELGDLDRKHVKFLLSYRCSTSFTRRLPRSWEVRRVRVRRNVAGFSDARQVAVEILVRNYIVS